MPLPGGHEITNIDAGLPAPFKGSRAAQDLSAGSRLICIPVVMVLPEEAQVTRPITPLRPEPCIMVDDGVRGYFDES